MMSVQGQRGEELEDKKPMERTLKFLEEQRVQQCEMLVEGFRIRVEKSHGFHANLEKSNFNMHSRDSSQSTMS